MELSKNPVSGQYIPWCRPDGGYYWRQCYGSYCFCVDQNGNEISKTRVYSSNGGPKCSEDGKGWLKQYLHLMFLYYFFKFKTTFKLAIDSQRRIVFIFQNGAPAFCL